MFNPEAIKIQKKKDLLLHYEVGGIHLKLIYMKTKIYSKFL